RARAARLYPNSTDDIVDESQYPRHYELIDIVVGPLMRALAARTIPLFIDITQIRRSEVLDLCAHSPERPVIVTNLHYTHKRNLFAGFAHYPNLHAEISGYHVHHGLEEVCAEFGPNRLIFGTRLPTFTPSSALAMVRYADLGPEEQRAIAGDNLRRLL